MTRGLANLTEVPSEPIALSVLTGFLGSGKTTLLRELLRKPEMGDTAVIINEFGEIGLDHQLVEKSNEEGMVELSSGCLCCTVRGDLVRTMGELFPAISSENWAALAPELLWPLWGGALAAQRDGRPLS